MSRDRGPVRKPARAPAKSAGGTLIGIFIGLVFGALIAAGAAWYFTRSNPFQAAPVAPRVQAPAEQGPAALPGKPGDRPVAKQDFEFYRILPQGDNVPSSAAQVVPVPAPQ
ncbi:MAG TPA: SPOR domain-containing protein, partial [Thauera aminoaromatica]|nr:SPOR domain-containing protein [Thauera aminoaromatica]